MRPAYKADYIIRIRERRGGEVAKKRNAGGATRELRVGTECRLERLDFQVSGLSLHCSYWASGRFITAFALTRVDRCVRDTCIRRVVWNRFSRELETRLETRLQTPRSSINTQETMADLFTRSGHARTRFSSGILTPFAAAGPLASILREIWISFHAAQLPSRNCVRTLPKVLLKFPDGLFRGRQKRDR